MDDESVKKGDAVKNAVPKPALLVAIVIGTLYLVEVIIMNFFHAFAKAAYHTMDALLFTAVLLPLLYFLIYRPFSKSVKDLKALSGTLERQVRERTVQLEFSEALHRAVIASSADAIIQINVDGVILMANPAAYWMFGYGKTELENKHISLLLPDGYEKVLVEGFAASLDGWDGHSAASAAEAVAVTKSGKKLTVECTSSECLVNSEISFVIDMRDVSDRRKAEEALREGERKFKRFFSMLPVALGVVDKDGIITEFNARFTEAFGYTIDDIPTIREYWERVYPDESYRRWVLDTWGNAAEKAAKEGRDIEPIEYKMTCKGGAERFVVIGGSILPDGGVLATFVDVTEKKNAEQAIRESEGRYRQLSEASFEGMLINIEGKVVDCNSAFARMFGYEPEEIIGRIPVDLSPPESQAIIMDHIRRGSEEVYDTIGRKKDGTLFPIEMQGRAILYHGQKARLTAMRDITARVKAEEAIRESEERYRQLSEASFEGVTITVDGKIADCNASFALKFGYTREGIIGKTPLDLVPPESYAVVADHIGRGSEERYEAVGRKKDGTLFPIEIQGRGTLYHGQKARVTAVRDITERIKAERAIRESEERLRATFDNATAGMAFVNPDGKFARINAALCRMYGYEEKELIGRSFQEITHPDDLHIGEAFLRKVARDETEKLEVEKRFIRKDGGIVWCSVVASLIKDAHGKPLHLFAHVIDVTARKSVENALFESENKYRALVEETSDWVWELDENGVFTYSSPQVLQITGYRAEELLGKTPFGHMRPEEARRAVEFFHATAAIQRPFKSFENTTLHKDGHEVVVETNGVPYFSAEGRFMGYRGINRDITERKAAEEKLKAAKEAAEEATKLKDKFVSLVSHDLKTPLSSMIGFLKLVRNDYTEPLNEGAKLILDRATESGEAMVHLIDDLLTISRFKTGQLKLNRQFFDAEYLGVIIAGNYAHFARQKGIEIESTIPAYSRIYGDKTLLTEAVQNLVTNAIKFCKSGDRITISAAEGDAPVIRVRDTGPGIPPNMLADLFKFEKKTSTLGSAGETGTGFGLPLVREIMELHRGDLDLISEPGKGCLVSLTLPYVRPKILLVDDDRHSRLLQTLQLREMNADIIEAENGEDALNKLAGVRPDLVITDIQMPVMDGLELLKRIKGAPETKDIPVIVVSGEFGMEIRDTVFKFGADDFVTKKIDKVDFFPRVRRFIG